MTPLEAMIDELAVADVHAGFTMEREALARQLLRCGIEPGDVALLAEHCRTTVEGQGSAARVLASILGDDRKRDDRLVDLREIAARKAIRAHQDERAPGDKPYVPGPVEGETREVWEHDRMCSIAKCRVDGDRVAIAVVARELGVSETTLGVMLERGRAMASQRVRSTAPAPKTVEDAERASQQRHVEFRQRMAADRAASAGRKGAPAFDWNRMGREQGAILAQIRQTGCVDIAWVMRDPVRRGALATLEADGNVLRQEAPDAQQRQRYRVAQDDAQRREFREQFRLWALQDMAKPRGKREEARS